MMMEEMSKWDKMSFMFAHLIPGAFFMLQGVWWAFILSVRQIQSKFYVKTDKKRAVEHGYRCSATTPVLVLPSRNLRRAPMESVIKLSVVFLGLGVEFYQGFYYRMDANTHALVLGYRNKNIQHLTMYASFGLTALVELFYHYNSANMPNKLDHTMSVFSFSIEAFIFLFHLDANEPASYYCHLLLFISVSGCVMFTALEIKDEKQILFTYGRVLFTFLQGILWCQTALVLFPPFEWMEIKWDSSMHGSTMVISSLFCWYLMLIVGFLFFVARFVSLLYASDSDFVRTRLNELILIDRKLDETFVDVKIYPNREAMYSLFSDDEEESHLIR